MLLPLPFCSCILTTSIGYNTEAVINFAVPDAIMHCKGVGCWLF